MILKTDFIDQIFDYPGLWDTPSKCGIKMIQHPGKTIVITTELYSENPGSSVTDSIARIANKICIDYGLNPENTVFIEHSPDMDSKMDFWNESFYRVYLTYENGELKNPSWKSITKQDLLELIKG